MRKQLLLSCVFAVCFGTVCAEASSIDSLKYDTSSQTVTVSGKADAYTDTDYRDVAMIIFAPGKTGADAENLREFDSSIIEQAAQITPEADGTFSYSYKVDTMNYGNHVVEITFADGSEYSDSLFFTTVSEDNALIQKINAADSKEKMLEVFSDYAYLFLGQKCYDEVCEFIPELKTEIAQKMLGVRYTASDVVCREIQKTSALAGLERMDTGEEFKEWMENKKAELGISKDTVYTVLYPASSDSVTGELMEMSFSSSEMFYKNFCDKVILDALNKIVNYKDIGYIIDNSKHYLVNSNLDVYYNDLSDTQRVKVQSSMTGKYTSISDFETKLKSEIAKAKQDVGGSTGGGTVSGGSGGGGSKGGGIISTGTTVPTNSGSAVATFGDLDSFSWAKDSIERLASKGIISGTGDNKFEPQKNVTREEFVKIIVGAYNLLDNNTQNTKFKDVDNNQWYAKYIASAYNAGIISGVSDTVFGIGEPITRQDMAVIAYRAAKLVKVTDSEKFKDDSLISDYAKDAVYTMKASGIMNGKGDGLFDPKTYATRAEAAKMIDNML